MRASRHGWEKSRTRKGESKVSRRGLTNETSWSGQVTASVDGRVNALDFPLSNRTLTLRSAISCTIEDREGRREGR